MSRKQHKHLTRIGFIKEHENKQKYTLNDLAEMSSKKLRSFLYNAKKKGINVPSFDAVMNYKSMLNKHE